MGFIQAYKRLEKLCGEILNDDRRVSAYIDAMINTAQGAYFVRSWDEDLKQLKHYRWVRNQIAHDPNCSEENMCSDYDTQWVVNFYARIMNQTDPLALYRKAIQPRQEQITKNVERQYYQEKSDMYYHETTNHRGCFVAILGIVVFVITILWLLR